MNATRYYIVGASGLAKEVYSYCRIHPEVRSSEFRGFLDLCDAPYQVETAGRCLPVLSQEAFLDDASAKGAAVFMAVGAPRVLADVSQEFGDDYEYPNLIMPGGHVDRESLVLGVGNIIGPMCFVGNDVRIGNFNLLGPRCTVGHDVEIGSCSVLNMGANLAGWVKVGDRCLVGGQTFVLERLNVGSNSHVCAGSVVFRDVESGQKVIGNPARVTKG